MKYDSSSLVAGFALMSALLTASVAHAQIVTFSGSDTGANNLSQMPNSQVSAASFTTAAGALGTVQTINFESAPLGSFTSLNAGSGVTVTGIDSNNSSQTIRNTPFSSPAAVYGFNTTVGGANFINAVGGTVTFTFAGGIQAFGAYITGLQLSGETITFNDGSTQTVNVPAGNINSGTSAFVGFTDSNRSIASVTVNASADSIGIDDVRFVSANRAAAAVPEPGEWATGVVFGISLLGLLRRARRRS